MDYERFKGQYDRDGFVIIRDFLGLGELAELNAQIDRFLANVVPGLPDSQVLYEPTLDGARAVRQIHRMSCDHYFDEYRHHPKWTSLARTLVGETVRGRPPYFFNKPADTDFSTPPHQDNCVFSLDPPNAVEILLATRERFDEESGCLRYLPGSHRCGMRPHKYSGIRGFAAEVADFGPDDEAIEAAVELAPGDVVCHHPLTVHRALRNRSRSRSRSGFSIWFQGESACIDSRVLETYMNYAARAEIVGH